MTRTRTRRSNREGGVASAPVTWLAALGVVLACVPVIVGCGRDSYMAMKSHQEKMNAQVAQTESAYRQLALDYQNLVQKNQQLQMHVADQGSQYQGAADSVNAVRSELATVKQQLADSQKQLADAQRGLADRDRKVQTLQASLEREGLNVSIQPNNSLANEMPYFGITGVEAKREGDVVRVTLPESLFFDASKNVTLSGREKLKRIAAKLRSTYPNQRITVEGHVRPVASYGMTTKSDHERSIDAAMAVFREITGPEANQLQPEHVSIHGAGASLGSRIAGACRVDLVVYPERAPTNEPRPLNPTVQSITPAPAPSMGAPRVTRGVRPY